MSNREAGNRFEKRIEQYLISLGFAVERARAKIIWIPGQGGQRRPISTSHDIFGCVDLVGVHPAKSYTLFVQTTLGDPKPRMDKLQAFRWNVGVQRVQLWQRQDGVLSGLRVRRLEPMGWEESIFRMKDGVPPPAEVL